MEGMGSSGHALRLGAAVLLGWGLGACNLLTGASDLDIAAEGTPSPTATNDGGIADTGPPGKEPPRDAGIDAEGGGPASPCTAAATFCDDFDGKTLSKWGVVKLGGATFSLDSLAAVSAPASLLMTFPATPTSNTVGAELSTSTKLTPETFVLRLAVRLEAIGNGDDASVHGIAQITLGTAYSLRLAVGLKAGTVFEETTSGPGAPSTSTARLTPGLEEDNSFHEIEISVAIKSPSATATVRIDNKSAGSKQLVPPASRETIGIVLGDRSVSGTTTDWRVRYDNVVLVAK